MVRPLCKSLGSRLRASLIVAVLALSQCANAASPANLLLNGAFNKRIGAALAVWTPVPGTYRPDFSQDGPDSVLSVTGANAAGVTGVRQTVVIKPEWVKVLVRGYVRVTRMAKTTSAGSIAFGATVDLKWRSTPAGLQTPAASPTWTAPTGGWVEINQLLDVPAGATELVVTPGVVGAVGAADFKDLSVVAWVGTFADEFDGDSMDTTRWTASDSDSLVYAPGEQYFAPDHVTVAGGIARFHAERKPHVATKPRPPLDGNYANTLYGDYQYQAGELQTIGKFQQLYGFWEFRLKVPVALGTWPAVYLLKWDDGWPPEIDVEESTGKMPETVLQTNVWADDYGKMRRSWVNLSSAGLDRTAWHTYAVAWEPGRISWYIDGSYKGSTGEPEAVVSDVPMYIRMNLAVGTFGGDPSRTTWPIDMDCDFAHVYQRHDLTLPITMGAPREITLPTTTIPLDAIACNPMTGATATWTIAEGPTGGTIAAPHSLTTTATVAKPGMYRFNLTVTKGASTASRDLLAYVNAH
ncbi:MAG TPA: glycoside hydrolase family 16 protein [Capsulimonadaceae bacterium]|jgi:beta-glucanase (GH16 family)